MTAHHLWDDNLIFLPMIYQKHTKGWHEGIFVSSLLLAFFPNFVLSKWSNSIIINGSSSSSFPILPWLLFINDFHPSKWNQMHSYADDSLLHSSTSYKSTPSSLVQFVSHLVTTSSINLDLARVAHWDTNNSVSFHIYNPFLSIS